MTDNPEKKRTAGRRFGARSPGELGEKRVSGADSGRKNELNHSTAPDTPRPQTALSAHPVKNTVPADDNASGPQAGKQPFGVIKAQQRALTPKRSPPGFASGALPAKPALYKVSLLNDDYTPRDFVVALLRKVFRKEFAEAMQIMLDINHSGAAVCGVFTYEVASTKVMEVHESARRSKHPLRCVAERM